MMDLESKCDPFKLISYQKSAKKPPNRAGGAIRSRTPVQNINPNHILKTHQIWYSNSCSSQHERVSHHHDEARPSTIDPFSQLCSSLSSKQWWISSGKRMNSKRFSLFQTIYTPCSMKSSNGWMHHAYIKDHQGHQIQQDRWRLISWLAHCAPDLYWNVCAWIWSPWVVGYLLKLHSNITHQDNIKDTLAEQLWCTKITLDDAIALDNSTKDHY